MAKKSLHLEIKGMSCDNCAHFISTLLNDLEGVVEQSVKHPEGKAVVKYRDDQLKAQKIVDMINKTQYAAKINN